MSIFDNVQDKTLQLVKLVQKNPEMTEQEQQERNQLTDLMAANNMAVKALLERGQHDLACQTHLHGDTLVKQLIAVYEAAIERQNND